MLKQKEEIIREKRIRRSIHMPGTLSLGNSKSS
jgi:hypothetical protein